jgi:hypothetical protein
MIAKIAVFYAVGAVVVGCFVAAMQSCATWRGKPLRYPRLIGGVIAGALWPSTLLQFLMARVEAPRP